MLSLTFSSALRATSAFDFFFLMTRRPPSSTQPTTLFPYTTLFRSRLQTETRHLCRAADGHQHLLGFEPAGVGLDGHACAPGLHRGHLHAGLHLDGPAPERPRKLLGDLLVLEGYQAGQRLEDRHLDAVGGVDVGELDADRARADHDDRFGRLLVAHGAIGGEHRLLVDGDAGQRLRLGAGREDCRRGLDRLGPARPGHLHGAARLEDATARDERDLVLPEQELDALRHAVGDAAAPLDRLGVARLETREPDAELRGAPEEVHDLGVAQERLGRDAPPVQADTAGPIVLDGRHRQAELSAPDRGDVAAGPRADDGDIDLHRLASHGGDCGNPDVLRLRTPFTGSPRTGAPAATPTCCGFALPSQARLARGRLRQPRGAAASHGRANSHRATPGDAAALRAT